MGRISRRENRLLALINLTEYLVHGTLGDMIIHAHGVAYVNECNVGATAFGKKMAAEAISFAALATKPYAVNCVTHPLFRY